VPRYVDQPQHEWEAWQQEFLDRVRGVGRGAETVHLHLHLDFDKPASAIVRFAVDHQSDLVILAWRGRLERDRALILRAILSAAPCPVLVVRVTA
jgi:nucleotide-binding universal stress UspA family protein